MSQVPPEKLKEVLERIYARYNRREFIGTDPLQFAYRYSETRDVEIAAFLAAALAYGRVEQIHKSLANLFGRMGSSPYDFVADWSGASRRHLASFKHRFTTGDDIGDLFDRIGPAVRQHGNLEALFQQGYDASEPNIVPALTRFCDRLCMGTCLRERRHGTVVRMDRGVMYLLASPARGSASKRLNLFLRWMVRKDDVDLGLWASIDKAKLIVPIDVHMARLCRILGFHNGKAISLSTALKITGAFAAVEPTDPVKYDFSLSRIGIIGDCTGRYRPECLSCELSALCLPPQRSRGTNGGPRGKLSRSGQRIADRMHRH
jgi:uncharacterized protein (TIGR02757 family)